MSVKERGKVVVSLRYQAVWSHQGLK